MNGVKSFPATTDPFWDYGKNPGVVEALFTTAP